MSEENEDNDIVSVPDLKIMDLLGLIVVWAGVIGLILITNKSPGAIAFGLLAAYYLSKIIITKKASL